MRYFAGIGSRSTPENVQQIMTQAASVLEEKGYILRSGGAEGADLAFEKGIKDPKNKQIYKPKEIDEFKDKWAFEEAKKFALFEGFDGWDPYVRKLLARNMMQVLGKSGLEPSEFIVCWTVTLDYFDPKVGGTGYALRCALNYNIPIFNLNSKEDVLNLKEKILGT